MSRTLSEIQELFSRTIRGEIEPELTELVIPGGRLSVNAALNLHRDGYVARLTEALGETYEAVWWVLGDEEFFKSCRNYISVTASHSPNLSDYGESFGDFILKEWGAEFPFIGELARFEWRFKELFHQPAEVGQEPSAFQAGANLEAVRFELIKPLEILKLDYAIYEIWKMRGGAEAQELPPTEGPQYLLLFRSDLDIFIYPLGEIEHFVLRGMQSGETLGRIMEELELKGSTGLIPEDSSATIQQLFQTLSSNRLIRRIYGSASAES